MTTGTQTVECCNLKTVEVHISAINDQLTIVISLLDIIRTVPRYHNIDTQIRAAMAAIVESSVVTQWALLELKKG